MKHAKILENQEIRPRNIIGANQIRRGMECIVIIPKTVRTLNCTQKKREKQY